MSSLSDTDFDLWDTICCSKCLLPFLSKSGPTIPFWLTECGHILCNNHLSKLAKCRLVPPTCPSYGTRSQSELHTMWCSRHSAHASPKRGCQAVSSSIKIRALMFSDRSPDVRVVPSDHLGAGCSHLFCQGSDVTFERALSKAETSCQFQQEMMAAQIMSLRSRYQQQCMIIDRLKSENSELKK